MTLTEIAAELQGQLFADDATQIINGAAQTDSREIRPGDLFFARAGESTDGHLFLAQAVANGAALAIVERALSDAEQLNLLKGNLRVPHIVVADSTKALGDLARASVTRLKQSHGLRVVGITGSVGKTSTKNFIQAMAEQLGETVASEKSFNNEVGAPVTMLRANERTRFLVTEMGANAVGDIAHLVRMAQPDIGVVLAVGLAHAEGFGGIESTFTAKSEMVTNLPNNALAVLNRDDVWVRQMAELTRARVLWFGMSDDAQVRASNIELTAHSTQFDLHANGQSVHVTFVVLGEHHVMNALAAVAVGLELGLTLEQAASTLQEITVAAPGRMQAIACRDDVTVINDAYNANPDSVAAALKTLTQIRKPGGRTIAVLGQMRELGEISGEEHDRIGLLAVRLRVDQLVVIGNEARRMHISAINEGSWDGESVFFETKDDALDYLVSSSQPADTVLVKASNSVGLQAFADRLAEQLA